MMAYIHSAALPVEDRVLYIMPHYRWTSIFGRDRVECIDVCISYHPAPTRYMSVFKHTETRHLSCGIRMSTNAEPDMDSVDQSNGSVEEWSFHRWRNTFASNQKDRPSEYFQENLLSLCPYLADCKIRILLKSINRFL